jgi:hypothetical protein
LAGAIAFAKGAVCVSSSATTSSGAKIILAIFFIQTS